MLRIKRQQMFVDMMRDYEVVIDGTLVGTVGNGETEVFELTPGHHLVHLKIDWCRSKKISLDVLEDETVVLHTGSSMRWFTFPFLYLLKLTIFRRNYINVKEENEITHSIEAKYNPTLHTLRPTIKISL